MGTEERGKKVEGFGGNRRLSEGLPDDDCCPICFGPFTVPCRSNCGHWYCGSCILQFWNYSSASQPCKCPMCACKIVNLMPETSLQQQQQSQEVTEVLKSVQRYNLLCVGGARGFIQKVREFPFLIKRMLQGLMDPDTNDSYIAEIRLFAMLLSIIYRATPFDFIPTDDVDFEEDELSPPSPIRSNRARTARTSRSDSARASARSERERRSSRR